MLESPMPELSPHLFWDTDPSRVDPEQHAAWLVKRVLEYGRWSDWQVLLKIYGRDRLGKIAVELRALEAKAAAFARAYFCSPSPQ